MAEETMAQAMELQWLSQDDVTLEDYSFSLKTGIRASAAWTAVHTAMTSFWSSLVGSGILNGATLRRTRLNNWETSGGFTGWHQMDQLPQSIAGGGASRAPTQLAVVASVLNISLPAINLGRRRNRCYLGPVPSSIFGGDGKITTGNITDIETALQDLHDDLKAISSVATSNLGLAVVSPTEGSSMHADQFGVGRAVDTHRSRRQKAVEGINYTTLIP